MFRSLFGLVLTGLWGWGLMSHPGDFQPVGPVAELGVYIDHRGDGAIEFRDCAGKICGRVVWLRDGAPSEACGREIIGNAALVKNGVWDGGWILDPEIDQKFDVEITWLNKDEIQVMGYLGSKALSETFVWKKAAVGLPRCGVHGEIAQR
ncbi:MAG: DUF2147 domain-containing protein [Alphaproteobacteria bacterium]|nr:DUF2147 domain-containing protein [Alphaproteobacteria bacterium]